MKEDESNSIASVTAFKLPTGAKVGQIVRFVGHGVVTKHGDVIPFESDDSAESEILDDAAADSVRERARKRLPGDFSSKAAVLLEQSFRRGGSL